uniref:Tubulin-specific chaperone E n=1 Tax=Oreochromis niloticus TaxID=8128 RepID=A0A669ET96_ORENI
MAEVPVDAVGKRVSCGGERATVRYFGPVPPTAGLWLGVEWDSPDRGKHDGSHEGVQYFTCRHPTGGSFVRPAKVSFGVDYLTAVRQAYKIDSEEVLSEEISISRKKLKWGNIKERGQQLDRLEGLQLSYNRLRLPPDPSALRHAFSALRVLVLNGCQLTWPQILECAPMWPQLEDLCVEENNITELQRPEGLLQSLKSLSLSSNPLVQDSVLSLSALPRLEQLNLSKTGLSVIQFEDAAPGSHTAMYAALKNLNLDHNNITEWFVVNELAKLPSLVRLSCRGNKLVSGDGNPKTANQMLIAKLEQLVVLNVTNSMLLFFRVWCS